MKVSDYRKVIAHGERLVNTDFHACVGEGELINWFRSCFLVLTEMSEADCKTAKPEDHKRKEFVLDRFSGRVDSNFEVWKKARALYMKDSGVSLGEVSECSEALRVNTEEIKKYSHEVKFYRSALNHFGSKAGDFKVRMWKKRKAEAESNLQEAGLRGEDLKRQALELIAQAEAM